MFITTKVFDAIPVRRRDIIFTTMWESVAFVWGIESICLHIATISLRMFSPVMIVERVFTHDTICTQETGKDPR